MRSVSLFTLTGVLFVLSSCGEAVPIDREAMNVENEARETIRKTEDDVNTAARAREDEAFEREQASDAAETTLGVRTGETKSGEVIAPPADQK